MDLETHQADGSGEFITDASGEYLETHQADGSGKLSTDASGESPG
jgi:hypothetical protein